MKNLENQKGITLVALVVTIIVLLILAAVSLSLVAGGDGILNRATTAVDRTEAASAQEQVELFIAETQADYYEAKYVTRGEDVGTMAEYVAGKLKDKQLSDCNVVVAADNVTVYVYAEDGQDRQLASGKITATTDSMTFTWDDPMVKAESGS